MLRCLFLIGLLGAMGAISRFAISHLPAFQNIPMGTFVVNIIGSLLLGLITGWTLNNPVITEEWRLALTTGFLGSFTTFSTFSVENARLIQQGQLKVAIINFKFSFVFCIKRSARFPPNGTHILIKPAVKCSRCDLSNHRRSMRELHD